MPQVEQRVALPEQGLADRPTFVAPVDHGLEVAPQVRPTPLQPAYPPVRLQAVAGGHLSVILAQQLLGYLPCPAVGDAEQAGPGGDYAPQVGPPGALTPGSLIDVDVLGVDVQQHLDPGHQQGL